MSPVGSPHSLSPTCYRSVGSDLHFIRCSCLRIVFFNTNCITLLSLAPVSHHLTHLRLLIPSRDIASSLTVPPPRPSTLSSPSSSYTPPRLPFPSLTYLDLSTTNVRLNTNVPVLLRTYPRLEHLVLDHTNCFGFLGRDREKGREGARELGRMCAVEGVGRAKDEERVAKRWVAEEQVRKEAWKRRAQQEEEEERQRLREEEEAGSDEDGEGREEEDETKRLAEELAALTTEEYKPASTKSKRSRGVRSMAMSTFSIRSNRATPSSSSTPGTSSNSTASDLPPSPPNLLIFILPPAPLLRTLSLGGEATLTPTQRIEWSANFQAGWTDGLERVAKWALDGVGDRFERARRKAEGERREWEAWMERGGREEELKEVKKETGGGAKGKGKGKSVSFSASTSTASAKTSTPPPEPPQVLLLRYPTPTDPSPSSFSGDSFAPSPYPSQLSHSPLSHLLEVDPASAWRDIYTDLAIPETAAKCVFCTVAADPGGGPLRRGGEEFGREKRETGVGVEHEKGCGHMVGREVWGEE